MSLSRTGRVPVRSFSAGRLSCLHQKGVMTGARPTARQTVENGFAATTASAHTNREYCFAVAQNHRANMRFQRDLARLFDSSPYRDGGTIDP